MKPNFFIVGTPKAGTTSLYHYLEGHPEIYMSPIKETNHFSHNNIIEQGLYYNNDHHVVTDIDYAAQFAGVTHEKAIGEASVSYLYYPDVAEKIKNFNKDAQIIIVLRNPVDRGFSHYLMDRRLGFVSESLQNIVSKKRQNKITALYYQQYISLGLYYEQIKRYLDTFGSDHVKIFLFEDMTKDIDSVSHEIYKYLGVDENYRAATEKKHNVFLAPKGAIIAKLYSLRVFRTLIRKFAGDNLQNKVKDIFFAKEKKPQLPPELKAEMQKIYEKDIRDTAKLINRDLSHWL